MNANHTYLARAFTLKELPGRLGKFLDVPPGWRGITVSRHGKVKNFGPGRQRVLSAGARLLGRGAGFTAGIIPEGFFSARLKAENLLSGDDQLMDASLLCEVEIIDGERFFTRQVLPRGIVQGNSLDLRSEVAWELLGALTRRYAAADLVHGHPLERMLPQIRAGLEALLSDQGLGLSYISLVTFWRAEDRALAAEKAQALKDRLREAELDEKMAQVESEAQFDDFVRQLEPHLDEALGLHPVEDETGPQEKRAPAILDSFRTWLNIETKKDAGGRRIRIDGLFRRKGKFEEETSRRGRRRPQRWWLKRVIWMGFVILAAYALTRLVNWIAGPAEWSARWEFYLAVGGFAALAVLESLKSLFQGWEELQKVHWTEPGTTFVDDLVGHDRLAADALVREQCATDLHNAQNMLNDLRSRVYKSGDDDTALAARDPEKAVAQAREHVLDPKFGIPPYVTDLNVSRPMWEDNLDYDEGLLVRSSALNEDAQALLQRHSGGEFEPQYLDQLRARLDAFVHRFNNRSQALKASEKDQKPYRMDL